MKAMILAAGLGTRLRHLTINRPKALMDVQGVPLLELLITRLRHEGFHELIINVHHLADQIREFLAQHHNFGLDIAISDETEALLDTGGGIRRAAWFLDDGAPFLVHNVDIVSDVDLAAMTAAHLQRQPLATLAVTKRPSVRSLLFDAAGQCVGWQNSKTAAAKIARPSATALTPLAFSGIHVISPAIFRLMPDQPAFSIIDLYLQAAAGGQAILGYEHDAANWLDVGTPENLARAAERYAHLLKKQGV